MTLKVRHYVLVFMSTMILATGVLICRAGAGPLRQDSWCDFYTCTGTHAGFDSADPTIPVQYCILGGAEPPFLNCDFQLNWRCEDPDAFNKICNGTYLGGEPPNQVFRSCIVPYFECIANYPP